MKIKKLATSLTIGTFLVTAVTGLLIFVEFTTGGVRAAHEWMGILFSFAGLFHALTHRKLFFNYFKGHYAGVIGLVLFIAIAFYTASRNDIYASGASFDKLTGASLDTLAPVLSMEKPGLIAEIEKNGFKVYHSGQSIRDIANANNADVYDIIEPLLK